MPPCCLVTQGGKSFQPAFGLWPHVWSLSKTVRESSTRCTWQPYAPAESLTVKQMVRLSWEAPSWLKFLAMAIAYYSWTAPINLQRVTPTSGTKMLYMLWKSISSYRHSLQACKTACEEPTSVTSCRWKHLEILYHELAEL